MIDDDSKENEPQAENVDDPRVLVSQYLQSEDFEEDFDRFNQNYPVKKTELDRFEGDKVKIDIYLKRRFLSEEDGEVAETSLANFMQTNHINFKYNPANYDDKSRKAIETYYGQWRDVNQRRMDIPRDSILKYDELQKRYHNDAAEAITQELTRDGIIPSLHKYFEDAEPQGMRNGIGREVVRRIRTDKANRGSRN